MSQFTLQQIARVLGGRVFGKSVRAPGPGHSKRDDSLKVWIDGEGRVAVQSFTEGNKEALAYVKAKLGIKPRERRQSKPKQVAPVIMPKQVWFRPAAVGNHFEVVAYHGAGKREILIKTEFEDLAVDLAERAAESLEGYKAVRDEGIAARNMQWANFGRFLRGGERRLSPREQIATVAARRYFETL